MGKGVCVTLFSFLLALLLGIGTALYARAATDQYQAAIALLESDVQSGEWDAALEKTRLISERWEADSALIQTFVIHTDVDGVTLALCDLTAAVGQRDLTLTLVYIAELNENVGHLYHRDAFTLKNIL